VAAGVLLAVTNLGAEAHVVVAPADSPAGATQLYTLAVPTESAADTVRVEAQFPRGLVVLQLEAPPGWVVTPEKDSGGHILGAVWDGGRTPSGQFGEFGVLAQNPDQATDLSWAVIQTYADGGEAQWIGPPSAQFPAAQSRVLTSGPPIVEIAAGAALACSLVALVLAGLTWRRSARRAASEEATVAVDATRRPLATG
jgi:uncharacterized protein YcnI